MCRCWCGSNAPGASVEDRGICGPAPRPALTPSPAGRTYGDGPRIRFRFRSRRRRSAPMHDKILIVDFGSQVTQLIARRVREDKVYCEIVPFQKAEEAFRRMKPKAVIFSGGPASVLDKNAPLAPKVMYDAGVPLLGICYGEQAMA